MTTTLHGKVALHGADSPDTAYLVDDYPYGFRLRTSIRYLQHGIAVETRNATIESLSA